jgi:hypothetical protein
VLSSRAVRIGIAHISRLGQEDTQLVKPTARFGTVEVTADGEGLVSHAGVALLVELADRVGLTAALSEALAASRERRSAHDPGSAAGRGGDAGRRRRLRD